MFASIELRADLVDLVAQIIVGHRAWDELKLRLPKDLSGLHRQDANTALPVFLAISTFLSLPLSPRAGWCRRPGLGQLCTASIAAQNFALAPASRHSCLCAMQESVVVHRQAQRPDFCEDAIPPAIFAAVRLLQICDPVQAFATDTPNRLQTPNNVWCRYSKS